VKFNDLALILNINHYGEDSAIIKVFSHHNGLRIGFVKNIHSKNQKNIYQIGNLINTNFYYKQPEKNLASFFYSELVKSYCLNFLLERLKFNLMQSLLDLLNHSLTENIVFYHLFEETIFFADQLTHNDLKNSVANYIKLELNILKRMGYGLDLKKCVATNKTTDLVFVSPKSGSAVCYEAGKDFAHKMLALPSFLINENIVLEKNHLQQGLALTNFFLKKFLNYQRKDLSLNNIL
jgi:DNA repair protein RecO (recombination protein O)